MDYRRARAAAESRPYLDGRRKGDRPRRSGTRRQAAGHRRPRAGSDQSLVDLTVEVERPTTVDEVNAAVAARADTGVLAGSSATARSRSSGHRQVTVLLDLRRAADGSRGRDAGQARGLVRQRVGVTRRGLSSLPSSCSRRCRPRHDRASACGFSTEDRRVHTDAGLAQAGDRGRERRRPSMNRIVIATDGSSGSGHALEEGSNSVGSAPTGRLRPARTTRIPRLALLPGRSYRGGKPSGVIADAKLPRNSTTSTRTTRSIEGERRVDPRVR